MKLSKIQHKLNGTKFKLVLLSLAVLGLSFLSPSSILNSSNIALAEEVTTAPVVRIRVSPVSERVKLTPGTKHETSMEISNDTEQGGNSFTFRVYANPYQVVDADYNANYEKEGSRTQISRWVTFEQEKYTLAPGEAVTVPYTINVPADVPDGGQYAVIFAETLNDGEGQTIATTHRVGQLLYATIDNGNTREEGEVTDINIKTFQFNRPMKVTSVVKNTGNTDFEADRKITVRSIFDDKEVYSATIPFTVLPDTSRNSLLTWEDAPALGIFKVTHSVTVLGKTESLTKTVIMIPLLVIVLVAIAILVVVLLIIYKVHGSKNKKSKAGRRR